MRHLILRENDSAAPTDLNRHEAIALATAELAEVSQSPDGTWMVGAGSKVGVVRVGDLQVSVRPKITVDRLIFLMGYARRPAYWRDQSVTLDVDAELPEALAHAFRRLSSAALEQGVLQGYRTVDDALPVLRGRIRVADQISRRPGIALPLEVRYDEYTVDIPENQILLAACLRLLRMPGIPRKVRHGLQRIRLQLGDVSAISARRDLPRWIPSRLNTRYHASLRLAELILQHQSFEQRIGELEVSGFVVDMWKVFEDFLCVALRESLAPYGGSASLQHRMHLDRASRVELRPDFLWTARDGRRLVVDAKYKAEKPSGFPQADLYQLLAYCTVLDLSVGHLVYAKGNEEEISHDIVGTTVSIHCHTVDLDAPPAEVLGQVDRVAERLVDRARVPDLDVSRGLERTEKSQLCS